MAAAVPTVEDPSALFRGIRVPYVPSKCRSFFFDPTISPAVSVASGDLVLLETDDEVYFNLSQGVPWDSIDDEAFNSVTGPVYVRGAKPGDGIRLDVLDIDITRAWVCAYPGYGCLGSQVGKLL